MSSTKKETKKRKHRTWEEGFQDLKAFFDEHGHCRAKSTSLVGRWAATQRKKRRLLTETQVARLNELQFDWESRDTKLDNQWNDMFQVLREYKLENGHTRVPQKEWYKGTSLGNWVTSQQANYRNNKIKQERKDKLESIGFEWLRDERLQWKPDRPLGKLDDMWTDKFHALAVYKEEHEHTMVPIGHMATLENGEEFDLGAFTTHQRSAFRDGMLRPEREAKIKSIGFVFTIDIYDAEASLNQRKWDEMFQKLVEYKETNGDCDVPANTEGEHRALGHWVRVQRNQHQEGKLAENRFQRLDGLGVTWNPLESQWNEMVSHLTAYKREHGDCKVPDSYQTKDGARLGNWVRTVRGARRGTRSYEISAERTAQLDELGFVWENVLHLHWDIMFEQLKKFKDKQGHTRVPQSYKSDDDNLPTNLGSWVSLQRGLDKKLEETGDPMYIERRKRLDSLGFDWSLADVPHENWDSMFERLERYKAQYGDCRVPYNYDEDCSDLPQNLGHWVSAQRATIPVKAEAANPVFVERKRRLDEIGFMWTNALHDNWERMFERLKQYKDEHGNCRVPRKYDHDCEGLPTTLGSWVAVQARETLAKAENGDPVCVERKQRLDEIGFEWSNVFEYRWEDMFERLKRYHDGHGNCRVPVGYDDGSDGTSLGSWVRNQQSDIPPRAENGDPVYLRRRQQLDSIGFEWDGVHGSKWQAMFEVLKRYKEEHGHCDVPFSHSDSAEDTPRGLGAWCYEQRKNIPPRVQSGDSVYMERKQQLDSVGFEWDVLSEKERKWNIMFARLEQYKHEYGHCRVPATFEGDRAGLPSSKLYSWVNRQQSKVPSRAEKGDPVYVERKRRLDSIGFDWNPIYDEKWVAMFNRLVQYKRNHGNCRVPYRKENETDEPQSMLGIWVYAQRTKLPPKVSKGDPVSLERKQRLDSIGFEWLDTHSSKWEVMFEGLERFKQKHGHCRVKRTYTDDTHPLPANLGMWLTIQRKNIPPKAESGDQVYVDRKQRLDALGFEWRLRTPPKSYKRGQKQNGTGDEKQAGEKASMQDSTCR